jgi:hypothetical protein
MSRVQDALEKSAGNHLKAQRLILNWIEKDHTLLFGLVAPHLQGIISHAVNHADAPRKKAMPLRIETGDEMGEFGSALIQSLKGGRAEGAGFGEAAPRNVGRPGKASKAHIDAIGKLISAGKNKDNEKK